MKSRKRRGDASEISGCLSNPIYLTWQLNRPQIVWLRSLKRFWHACQLDFSVLFVSFSLRLMIRLIALGARKLGIDHGLESVDRLRAHHAYAVDEKGRSAFDAKRFPFLNVFLYLVGVLVRVKALVELRLIQPKLFRRRLQVVDAELRLVGKKRVVVLPEASLVTCAMGRDCSFHGLTMERQWEIAMNEP